MWYFDLTEREILVGTGTQIARKGNLREHCQRSNERECLLDFECSISFSFMIDVARYQFRSRIFLHSKS